MTNDNIDESLQNPEEEEKKRTDWIRNDELIRSAFLELLTENKKAPSTIALAERTGISRQSVAKHLEEMTFEKIKTPFKSLSDEVLISVYASARRGNSQSQKLWFQLVEGWSEVQTRKNEFENEIPFVVKVDYGDSDEAVNDKGESNLPSTNEEPE